MTDQTKNTSIPVYAYARKDIKKLDDMCLNCLNLNTLYKCAECNIEAERQNWVMSEMLKNNKKIR